MTSIGLCTSCRHRRIVRSDRGSRFVLCRLAREDPRYPRYPRLPVRSCDGWEPTAASRRSAEPAAREGTG